MDRPDHIRNPIEWGFDQITLAALAVGSLGHSLRGSEESRGAPLPAVRRIKAADLKDVLVRGLRDFEAYRSDVMFLCLIYPIVGIALVWLTFGYEMLPLVFPLAFGFALVGPVAAVGLYEMSRRREQGIPTTWADAFGAIRSPGFGAILVLGLVLLAIFLLWLFTANLIYQITLGPEPPVSIAVFIRDVFTTSAGWVMIIVGRERWFPLRLPGAGDQRGVVSAIARPGRRARRGGVDVDPRCGCEPGTDAALGFDRGGWPFDRVNTRIPWSYLRHARAWARHLAPIPQGGGVNSACVCTAGALTEIR